MSHRAFNAFSDTILSLWTDISWWDRDRITFWGGKKKPTSILKGWCSTLNKNWETCDGQGKWLLKRSWNIPTHTCIFSWAGLDLRGNTKTCHLLIFSSNSVLISGIVVLYFTIVIRPICTKILFFFWYTAKGVYHSLSLQCYNCRYIIIMGYSL